MASRCRCVYIVKLLPKLGAGIDGNGKVGTSAIVLSGGYGVAKDDVTAYMWTNLAAASGAKSVKSAKELRGLLERKMTAEEIAEARLLSRDWKPRPYQGE